jgi:hypothetical protein
VAGWAPLDPDLKTLCKGFVVVIKAHAEPVLLNGTGAIIKVDDFAAPTLSVTILLESTKSWRLHNVGGTQLAPGLDTELQTLGVYKPVHMMLTVHEARTSTYTREDHPEKIRIEAGDNLVSSRHNILEIVVRFRRRLRGDGIVRIGDVSFHSSSPYRS